MKRSGASFITLLSLLFFVIFLGFGRYLIGIMSQLTIPLMCEAITGLVVGINCGYITFFVCRREMKLPLSDPSLCFLWP